MDAKMKQNESLGTALQASTRELRGQVRAWRAQVFNQMKLERKFQRRALLMFVLIPGVVLLLICIGCLIAAITLPAGVNDGSLLAQINNVKENGGKLADQLDKLKDAQNKELASLRRDLENHKAEAVNLKAQIESGKAAVGESQQTIEQLKKEMTKLNDAKNMQVEAAKTNTREIQAKMEEMQKLMYFQSESFGGILINRKISARVPDPSDKNELKWPTAFSLQFSTELQARIESVEYKMSARFRTNHYKYDNTGKLISAEWIPDDPTKQTVHRDIRNESTNKEYTGGLEYGWRGLTTGDTTITVTINFNNAEPVVRQYLIPVRQMDLGNAVMRIQ